MRTLYPFICVNCKTPKNGYRKTSKYCNSRCQMIFEYSSGQRDPHATTAAAHESIRINGIPSRRGKPIPHLRRPEIWAKVSATKTGLPCLKQRGANHWNWKGGKSKDPWKTPEYQAWRKEVFRRDKFTCVMCGDSRGGNLEADHIKPRHLFPELALELSNGRTLCIPCHKSTPTWGSKVLSLSRSDF
jgi:5-methylcytosine-specific restriction endonuclease McrA